MSSRPRWPLPSEFSRTSSPFGARRHPVTHKEQTHSGIDVPCPQGTEIRAPCDSTIRSAWMDETSGGGLSVVLDAHAYPLRVGFAHLSAVKVKKGQKIRRGALVGLSGGKPGTYGAGHSTGPHLHITVRNADTLDLLNPDGISWEGRAAE